MLEKHCYIYIYIYIYIFIYVFMGGVVDVIACILGMGAVERSLKGERIKETDDDALATGQRIYTNNYVQVVQHLVDILLHFVHDSLSGRTGGRKR